MEIVTYKSLEWYVMSENNKEKLLLMKDCFTNKMIKKYFDEYDEFYNVKFNSNSTDGWWINSYVRKILNEKFILDLGKEDLNSMNFSLNLGNKQLIIEDYVRLLTMEETEKLSKEVLKTERKHGYFTMTLDNFGNNFASVCVIGGCDNPGYIGWSNINNSYGIRPVISLKPDCLEEKLSSLEDIKSKLLKMIYILNNNDISDKEWVEYYFKYESLKSYNNSLDYMILISILGNSLISKLPLSKIDIYNEWKNDITKDLNNSKKLIKLKP